MKKRDRKLVDEGSADDPPASVDRRGLIRSAGLFTAATFVGIGLESRPADAAVPFNLTFTSGHGLDAANRSGSTKKHATAGDKCTTTGTDCTPIVPYLELEATAWQIIGRQPYQEDLPFYDPDNYDYLVFTLLPPVFVDGHDDDDKPYMHDNKNSSNAHYLVVIIPAGSFDSAARRALKH